MEGQVIQDVGVYWPEYFSEVDKAIEENFWGNLSIYRKSLDYGDPYVHQLMDIGYSFQEGDEHPAPFWRSINYMRLSIQKLVQEGRLQESDILLPGKAFKKTSEASDKDGDDLVFVVVGGDVDKLVGYAPLNLLTPHVFVTMLSRGYFPIGEAMREHTNQTLAEHDLAHMGGFVSCPEYMRCVRHAFRRVEEESKASPRVAKALTQFDSLYSLRLYYLIEIFTEVPLHARKELQSLIEWPIDRPAYKADVCKFLLDKARASPVELARYLSRLYSSFHALVNALGGESRDMLNRRRKFHKTGQTLGTFYDSVSTLSSKFNYNSIYSLFYNAKAALENKRSSHPDYERTITEVHAPLIGALIGTAQLDVADWVSEAVEPVPRQDSKLYRYIHDSGFWDERHVLYWAYTKPEFDLVLTSDMMA